MEKHMKTMTTAIAAAAPTTPSPTSPAPTTFVQADPNTFKDLVQKLTGSSGDTEKLPVTLPTRLSSKPSILVDPTGPRRSPFKLQDRRQTMRKLEIKLSLATIGGSSGTVPAPGYQYHLSPRQIHWVDSPIPSPVTPLGSESLFVPSSGSPSPSSPAVSEEERAIADKGFYLHPSPLSTPRASEPPELLNLFPLTSPSRHLDHHDKARD
ncbi:hypothetical protein L484_007135 [Morus notabilis]|uniref:VQ domain-containing protein n=1 Tax=Morus notabilis TaxID=981085 RepID=W9RZ63_9ROSA|nr:VQ motif-containing protein 33 [Morus notabilis]EXC18763.1 hypothetical protein L484_007135 [Morus notabilis]